MPFVGAQQVAGAFNQFVHQRTVLLSTYRRDGTPVGTPVNIVVDGDLAFVRTFDTAWKLKRIRNNPTVEIATSTAHVIRFSTAEHSRASRALNKKYPILHGVLVPLAHRLQGYKTVHIELTPLSSVSRESCHREENVVSRV